MILSRFSRRLKPAQVIISHQQPARGFRYMSSGEFFSKSTQRRPRIERIASLALRRAFSNGPRYNPPICACRRFTWALIGINAAVFAGWRYAKAYEDRKLLKWLLENTALSEGNYQAGRYHTLITSAFSHQNPFHFLFNMIALNTFGTIISLVPGVGVAHLSTLALGSAVASSLAWLRYERSKETKRTGGQGWLSRFRSDGNVRVRVINIGLGASGLVMGCAAAATMLMPFAPMQLMFMKAPIPLYIITGGYVAIDTFFLNSKSRVGHSAHLGGFLFGTVYYFTSLRRFGGIWQLLRRGIRK